MIFPVDYLSAAAGSGVEEDFLAEAALRNSLGAILLGGLICMFLSGIVSAQTFLYYRIYPKDLMRIKSIVTLIWFIDIFHSAIACTAVWSYLINNFGDFGVFDYVHWTIAVTVALTALSTFIVQGFFAHRIHTLSRGNWWVSAPIGSLAFVRFVAALVSTAEMIRLRSFSQFVDRIGWVFTLGLSLGAAMDVVIAISLCLYLRRSRTGFSSMDRIIDSITLYTIENGMLTCITTVVSLICWIAMPYNLIFLGLHLAITKLYANSFLATLNARRALMSRSQGSSDRNEHPLPVLFPSGYSRRGVFSSRNIPVDPAGTKLQINVEKTIQHEVEGEPSEAYANSDTTGQNEDADDISKVDVSSR